MYQIPLLNKNIFKIFKTTKIADRIDQLNFYSTPTLLILFALFISAKQYIGKPIQCWLPMEFKSGWEQYVEDFCFVQNTYQIPGNETFNTIDNTTKKGTTLLLPMDPIATSISSNVLPSSQLDLVVP